MFKYILSFMRSSFKNAKVEGRMILINHLQDEITDIEIELSAVIGIGFSKMLFKWKKNL